MADKSSVRTLLRYKLEKPKTETISQQDFKLKTYLETKSKSIVTDSETFLLSFHDDGVVWGKVKVADEQSELVTSGDYGEDDNPKLPNTPSPKFRKDTLQECRLFSKKGELYIWRVSENQFKARLVEDVEDLTQEENCFDESQVLWGTRTENGNDDFTVIVDGSEGLRHAFPQKVDANEFDDKKRPLSLCVRHYLSYDEDGCAYISLSRLVIVEV